MKVITKKTKGFSEPLYTISRADDAKHHPLAYIGAQSAEQALLRVELVRAQLHLQPGTLTAEFFPAGPVRAAAFYSSAYFKWIQAIADEQRAAGGMCPLCERPL